MPQKRSTAEKTASKKPATTGRTTRDLERLFVRRGFADFRWLDPRDIVVAEWVRMKCLFGCVDYGKNAACPPNTPPVDACARFFREYKRAVVFHFAKAVEKPEDRHAWSRKINLGLLDVEGEVFKAGFVKAFLLPMDSCNYCLGFPVCFKKYEATDKEYNCYPVQCSGVPDVSKIKIRKQT